MDDTQYTTYTYWVNKIYRNLKINHSEDKMSESPASKTAKVETLWYLPIMREIWNICYSNLEHTTSGSQSGVGSWV